MARLKNDKHERFCSEYIKDLHLTKAYARVYQVKSETTASASAGRLLGNAKIQDRIRELMAKREKRTGVTQDMVVQRLADLAFGHLGMICTWDENGLVLLDSKDLTEPEMAIIANIKMIPVELETYAENGDKKFVTKYRKEVSQKDSLKALELLCKHLGMLDGPGSGKSRNRAGDSARMVGALADARKRLTEWKDK